MKKVAFVLLAAVALALAPAPARADWACATPVGLDPVAHCHSLGNGYGEVYVQTPVAAVGFCGYNPAPGTGTPNLVPHVNLGTWDYNSGYPGPCPSP